jgi:hypothetical protein
MKEVEFKENEFLLLKVEDINVIKINEVTCFCEGSFNTPEQPMHSSDLIPDLVFHYMHEDGQLIRTIPELLKLVLNGVKIANEDLEETKDLGIKDANKLIESAFKKACNNF